MNEVGHVIHSKHVEEETSGVKASLIFLLKMSLQQPAMRTI